MKIFSILVTRYHEGGTGSMIFPNAFKSLQEAESAIREHARGEWADACGDDEDDGEKYFRKLGATNYRLIYSPEAGVQYQIFSQVIE